MSPQAGWILQEEIAPRIAGAVPRSVLSIGAEDSQELIADGICMAAKMVDRLEQQNKIGKVSPGNVSYYCLQHLKSGRRSMGSSSVDVHGSQTQLNGTTILHSLNEVVSVVEGDEIFELQDVISQDEEDPAEIACRKIDWDNFISQLSLEEMLVITFLLIGNSFREAGREIGWSDSMMQTCRKSIGRKILDFMGSDILADIVRRPGWKIGLECERERLACRADRRG